MKRWTTRVLICLLLGMVINIAVAWGCAFATISPLNHGDGNFHWSCEDFSTSLYIVDFPDRAFWMLERRSLRAHFISGEMISFEEEIYPELPTWVRDRLFEREQGLPCPSIDVRAIEVFGWPFRSLFLVMEVPKHVYSLDGAYDEPKVFGAINLPRRAAGFMARGNGYPLIPLWIPFVCNTVAYATAWWLLFYLPLLVRRMLRRIRGFCPNCKYDLRHDFTSGCPECGWRRGNNQNEPRVSASGLETHRERT